MLPHRNLTNLPGCPPHPGPKLLLSSFYFLPALSATHRERLLIRQVPAKAYVLLSHRHLLPDRGKQDFPWPHRFQPEYDCREPARPDPHIHILPHPPENPFDSQKAWILQKLLADFLRYLIPSIHLMSPQTLLLTELLLKMIHFLQHPFSQELLKFVPHFDFLLSQDHQNHRSAGLRWTLPNPFLPLASSLPVLSAELLWPSPQLTSFLLLLLDLASLLSVLPSPIPLPRVLLAVPGSPLSPLCSLQWLVPEDHQHLLFPLPFRCRSSFSLYFQRWSR